MRLDRLAQSATLAATIFLVAGSVGMAQDRALREQGAKTTRIALLIGNSHYSQTTTDDKLTPLKSLANPCNDVTRIAASLERSQWNPGTEIIKVCDATRSQLRDAVDQFKDIYLSSEATFGFIYYAGHGVQVGSDTYFFGVDSQISLAESARAITNNEGASVFRGGVRLFADIISQVGDAGSGSIFIVVDACRETPFDRMARSDPNLSAKLRSNLALPRPALGVKLLYSTTYGELASDGIGQGSPFALAFEEQLRSEGRVDRLVSRVIKAVKNTTRDASIRQIPDTTGALNPPPPEDCLSICEDSR